MDHATLAWLAQLEQRLEQTLDLAGPAERARLTVAARHLALASGARRARPLLCRALATACGAHDPSALLDAAVAVELVHTASLLHDDVVDGDELRRGISTVNAREGNAFAVLTGDHVLARALRLLRAQPATLACALAVLERMTEGALLELEARRDPGFDLTRWVRMAQGKTGVLFALCGAAAAHAAHDEARAERFYEAGLHLGVAFQIADDVADLAGGDDLRERNPSYPVLAAAAVSPRVRDALDAIVQAPARETPTPSTIRALVREVRAARGVDAARDAARREVTLAREAFGADAAHGAVASVLGWADALVENAAPEAA